jgi:nitrogen regulatory protein PII
VSVPEEIIETIERQACTGLRGNGKIFVSSENMAVRIGQGDWSEGAG